MNKRSCFIKKILAICLTFFVVVNSGAVIAVGNEQKLDSPNCICAIQCKTNIESMDESCTICSASLEQCAGDDIILACSCAKKCMEDSIKEDCTICSASLGQCAGDEIIFACNCAKKCMEDSMNEDCTTCLEGMEQCTGTETALAATSAEMAVRASSPLTITGGTEGVDYQTGNSSTPNCIEVLTDTPLTFTGSTYKYILVKSENAKLTFDNATINPTVQSKGAVIISGNRANITIEGKNLITGGNREGQNGIYVPSGKSVAIDGSGDLDVKGGPGGAGIGTSIKVFYPENGFCVAEEAGTITINGGNINATGGKFLNSTSTRYGGSGGPGIGGRGASVSINGGKITATGGDGSAGIGGLSGNMTSDGVMGSYPSDSILIENATVTANGGISSIEYNTPQKCDGGHGLDAKTIILENSNITAKVITNESQTGNPIPNGYAINGDSVSIINCETNVSGNDKKSGSGAKEQYTIYANNLTIDGGSMNAIDRSKNATEDFMQHSCIYTTQKTTINNTQVTVSGYPSIYSDEGIQITNSNINATGRIKSKSINLDKSYIKLIDKEKYNYGIHATDLDISNDSTIYSELFSKNSIESTNLYLKKSKLLLQNSNIDTQNLTTGGDGDIQVFARSITGTTLSEVHNGLFFIGSNTGILYGNSARFYKDFFIDKYQTINIKAGQTLVVPTGITLINEGIISIDAGGKLINNGTIFNRNTINGSVTGTEPVSSLGGFIIDGPYTSYHYNISSKVLYITGDEPLTISGETSVARIVVSEGVNANLTFNNLNIETGSFNAGSLTIENQGSADIVLMEGSSSKLSGGILVGSYYVSEGSASVTIGGNGNLTVGSEDTNYSIGHSRIENRGGTITINGGNITATGYVGGNNFHTIINGGNINVKGNIGGYTYDKFYSTITLSGGNVTTVNSESLSTRRGGFGGSYETIEGQIHFKSTDVTNCIYENATLIIPENTDVFIEDGVYFNNKGNLLINGTLNNNGTFYNDGVIKGTVVGKEPTMNQSTKGITVEGEGERGKDYCFFYDWATSKTNMTIYSSKHLTLSSSSLAEVIINIEPGVTANLTLNNLSCKSLAIRQDAVANVTLADSSENTISEILVSDNNSKPGTLIINGKGNLISNRIGDEKAGNIIIESGNIKLESYEQVLIGSKGETNYFGELTIKNGTINAINKKYLATTNYPAVRVSKLTLEGGSLTAKSATPIATFAESIIHYGGSIKSERAWGSKATTDKGFSGEVNPDVNGLSSSDIEINTSLIYTVPENVTLNIIEDGKITNNGVLNILGSVNGTIEGSGTTLYPLYIATTGIEGKDYTYIDQVLTVLTSTPISVSSNGKLTGSRIVVPDGVNANIELNDICINTENYPGESPIYIQDNGAATITLSGTNKLQSPEKTAAIRVENTDDKFGTVNICGDGSLHAIGKSNSTVIGANHYKNAGSINIESGSILLEGSGTNCSGIGYGNNSSYTIKSLNITGGNLRVIGCNKIIAASVSDSITISGGSLVGNGNVYGELETGEKGTAFIDVSYIGTSNSSTWKGMIFNGNIGKMYGDSYTLQNNIVIQNNKNLSIDNGQKLIVTKDKKLTIENEATLTLGANCTLENKGTLNLRGNLNYENNSVLSGEGEFNLFRFTSDDIEIKPQGYTGNPIEIATQDMEHIGILGIKFNIDLSDYQKSYDNNIEVGDQATVTLTHRDVNVSPITKSFGILQSSTSFEDGIKTYKDSIQTSNFTYGDNIILKITPKATGIVKPTQVLSNFSLVAPSSNQMALYVGEKQITDPQSIVNGQELTFIIDTTEKEIPIGTTTITAKYVGNASMDSHEESVEITLAKKPLTATINSTSSSATKEYDGNSNFNDIELLLNGVLAEDVVTGVAIGTVVDSSAELQKQITATLVNLAGEDCRYYYLEIDDITGNVSITPKQITESMFSGIDGNYYYTALNIEPSPNANDGSENIITENDFTIQYMDNKNVGTATICITGQNNYSGEIALDFEILPATPTATFTQTTLDVLYNGSIPETEVANIIKVDLLGTDSYQGHINYKYKATEGSGDFINGLPKNVGTYIVSANIPSSQNYNATTFSNELTLQIEKVTTTLTIDKIGTGGGKVYDGTPIADPSDIQVSCNIQDPSIVYTYFTNENGNVGALLTDRPTNSGAYWVVGTIANTEDTSGVTAKLPFTIEKAPIVIVGGIIEERVWSPNDTSAPLSSIQFSGLANGENLIFGVDYSVINTNYENSNAGIQKEIISGNVQLANTIIAANYLLADINLSNKGINGVVRPRNLIVTFANVESYHIINDSSKINYLYDVEGLLEGDSLEKLMISVNGYSHVDDTKPGNYQISASVSMPQDCNYTVTVNEGIHTVLPIVANTKVSSSIAKDCMDITVAIPNESIPTSITDLSEVALGLFPATVKDRVALDTVITDTLSYSNRAHIKISLIDNTTKQILQPAGDISIFIPYPEGGSQRHNFKVLHLANDGTIKEELIPQKLSNGISFTVNSLSPFCIGWVEARSNGSSSSSSSSTPLLPETVQWENPFGDVKVTDWFYEKIAKVSELGLMKGTSDKTFEPNAPTTRAMMLTVLYNEAAKPNTIARDSKWYANAQAWSIEKGISDGTNMMANITREQLITMLWRNAGSPAMADYDGITNFTDVNIIVNYAKQAFAWGHEQGIINGKGNNILDPKGYATRAEMATMIINYLNSMQN